MNTRDVISQAEVDALLLGVLPEGIHAGAEGNQPRMGGIRRAMERERAGEGARRNGQALAQEMPVHGEVQPFDVAGLEHIVRGRMPTLELINERFVRHLHAGLLEFTGQNAAISVGQVAVQKYSAFASTLGLPSNCNIVAIRPLRGNGMMVCDPMLISAVIDLLYGGSGRLPGRLDGRNFSDSEQRALNRLVNLITDAYNRAWRGICPLELVHLRSEVQPELATIAVPGERVMTTSFQLEIGEASGEIHFCFPCVAMEPLRDILHSATQADFTQADRRWVNQLTREMQSVEVTLVAQLAVLDATVAQLVSMKAGDFIGLKVEPQISALVDGVPVFACQYGTVNARHAIRINRRLSGDGAGAGGVGDGR